MLNRPQRLFRTDGSKIERRYLSVNLAVAENSKE